MTLQQLRQFADTSSSGLDLEVKLSNHEAKFLVSLIDKEKRRFYESMSRPAEDEPITAEPVL